MCKHYGQNICNIQYNTLPVYLQGACQKLALSSYHRLRFEDRESLPVPVSTVARTAPMICKPRPLESHTNLLVEESSLGKENDWYQRRVLIPSPEI